MSLVQVCFESGRGSCCLVAILAKMAALTNRQVPVGVFYRPDSGGSNEHNHNEAKKMLHLKMTWTSPTKLTYLLYWKCFKTKWTGREERKVTGKISDSGQSCPCDLSVPTYMSSGNSNATKFNKLSRVSYGGCQCNHPRGRQKERQSDQMQPGRL